MSLDLLILLPVQEDGPIRKPLSSSDPSTKMEDMYTVNFKQAIWTVSSMLPLQKLFQIIHTPKLNTKMVVKKPLSSTDPTRDVGHGLSLQGE